ncbi:MAG: SPFH domain-containing protein [Lachnospiraceae bacterium]|nr:SPFH domain-containing protein [Lachnospiraceae bacterium]
MGLFSKQLLNVVEWNENKEGILFWKWPNAEIKKGSKLIIRMGQDAIFMYNGRVEGIFEDEGEYDVESQIIPFLSTLKSFTFGFNTPLRAEVMFINTKEQLVKWGTKNAINLPAAGLPGGMPVRAFGTFACKIAEHDVLIEKMAGIQTEYGVENVKERIIASLDQLLMSWIGKEGRDIFNLQADARTIAAGIRSDLDMEMRKIGIAVTDFNIESFSYPEEIKKMQEKAAAQAMVGDVGRYQQMAAADSMSGVAGGNGKSSVAGDMVSLQMGMALGQQMVNQMKPENQAGVAQTGAAQGTQTVGGNGTIPKFCPNCGTATNGSNFCSNCGQKLI